MNEIYTELAKKLEIFLASSLVRLAPIPPAIPQLVWVRALPRSDLKNLKKLSFFGFFRILTLDELRIIINGKKLELAEIFNVSNIFIFGSYAKDMQTPESYIDILVETTKPIGLFKFVNLKQYFENLLGKKIDLGTPNGLKPLIKTSILSEAVRI